jgi:hypothetical protein
MIRGLITGGVKGLDKINVDLRKSSDKVGAIIRSYLIGQMESSSGEKRWAKLAPSTLRKKRRTPRPFDTTSREMWESFTQKSHGLHHHTSGKTFIEVGSDMEDIPMWQMEGTRTIPARSIVVTNEMATEVVEAIADEIMAGL